MKRILIVDDHREIRELVANTLRRRDYEVLMAENGEAAVRMTREQKPDLVLMDVVMPGAIDGLEATRILKSDPETRSCPIIMLTGRGEIADREKGRNVGADDYFGKPFSPLELMRKVDEFVAGSKPLGKMDMGGGQAPETEQLQGEALTVQQGLQYARDLAKIYEKEKVKRKALEKANQRLRLLVRARRQAEQELERRVGERTRELENEVAQRKRAEEQIRASLREKETLLSEIHHRVKNNLQIVCSLLALQSDFVADEKILGVLNDSRGRIRSMALIHEKLYRSEDLSRIDFSDYIHDVTKTLFETYPDKATSVSIRTEVQSVLLPVGVALPCGLIINELVTNSLKHAFPGSDQGEVRIEFRRAETAGYTLIVGDNGRGLPKEFDPRASKSLGLQLVVNLVELQLRGSLEVHSNGGTTFKMYFPDREKS